MSHVARPARLALLALLALAPSALFAACSSPKPPAGEAPAVSSSGSTSSSGSDGHEPAAPEPATAASEPAPPTAEPATASDAPVVETLFVRESVADCQAEGTQQCLQVRSSEQEDWRNFFGAIEGFQYEPAYAYELRVAVSPVPNAPADAPSLHYRLLEVVSKRKPVKSAK